MPFIPNHQLCHRGCEERDREEKQDCEAAERNIIKRNAEGGGKKMIGKVTTHLNVLYTQFEASACPVALHNEDSTTARFRPTLFPPPLLK